jgi:hypothetical protein
MTIAAHSILPILAVLENGGRINIEELSRKLVRMDPNRFREDASGLIRGIESNINCLKIEGNNVIFDKTANSYTKHFSLIERSAQRLLHNSIPNMNEWELYPYMTRKNSTTCNLGIDWEDIPEENNVKGPEWFGYQQNCNFREQGKKYCGFCCGIEKNKAIGKIYALFDDFSVIGELHQTINRR